MKCSLQLALVSLCASIPAVRSISLKKCSYRMTNMGHGDGTYHIAVFDCDFDEDLYLKSRIDQNLDPIPSVASKESVATSIAESEIVSSLHWSNFAGLTIEYDSAVPNSLFSYSHNVKLSCQHEGIDFEVYQRPSHDAPVDFLYSLPPTRNAINELWQAFGAYKWPEVAVPRRLSVGLMVSPFISQDDIEMCIDHGKLVVSTDTRPLEDCPECDFPPLSGGCSADECSIWHYSDSLGNPINPLASVPVEYADNECSLETFTNFTNDRLPQLYELLESSKTAQERHAAMLSYTTIVNNIDYAACKDIFDSFYTRKSASVFMKGVRGCEDPSNMDDPCCHENLLWSDCCLPEDKHLEIDGIFNATNLDAVNDMCGANNAASVAALLDSEISEVLISASHPEFGCNAAYEKVNPQGEDLWQTLWDESPVSKCEQEVRWGRTTNGLDMCSSNEECWSGSCSDSRCTQLYGEAISGPLLKCIANRVDKKLWKYMANGLNIDPSKIKKGALLRGPMWKTAVEKFKALVGRPNCVGEEADRGICAILITKEECHSISSAYDWSRKMEWVDTTSEANSNGGLCKKRDSSWWDESGSIHIHGHTENIQEDCEAIFTAMGGACVDSNMPAGQDYKDQSECTGETETWFPFASHAIVGHRLVSQKIHMLEETSGKWVESIVEGEKDKCTLQTACNWDPDNRVQSDKALCLDPSSLETTSYPRASYEEDGKHMTCLQCHGSRCEDFYGSNPPVCAVRPHHHDDDNDCAQNSGGGPNNDLPVSAMTALEGHDSHMKCRRNDLKTESECLPVEFCPLPSEEENPWDDMLHHCAESGCWDLTKTEETCRYDETTEISFGWRHEYRGGLGACRVDYDNLERNHFEEKATCTAKGFMWWEGRAFKPGQFHTAEECTTYCNDGTWPLQKTCASGSCDRQCAQCVVGNSWQFPDGAACYLSGDIDEQDCFSLDGYEWDWNTKLCYRKDFTGTDVDCIDFDTGPGDNPGLQSMSMTYDSTFDFLETEAPEEELSLVHHYVSCPAQTQETCAAYCWSKDSDDYTSCQSRGLEWDWSISRCKHPTWMVNRASSPTCESYMAGLDENTNEHERWENGAQCWENGCHFEAGNVGFSAPSCVGQARGCEQQEGNTEWVDGGGDAAAKLLLGCRWDMWKSCPTEETCESAGECEDWYIRNGGSCIVPLEPDEWGRRKGCYDVKHPIDGTAYDWAGALGCIARESQDGVTTNVKEDECSSVGGTWHVRATSQSHCEDERDDICTHPFDEWRVFGGITSEQKCDTCGYKTTPPTKWRKGIWSDSAETDLFWVERSFESKNKWEENSFDSSAFQSLVRNSFSRYIADAFKTKVYCELGAYNAFIPAIISMCTADGDNEQSVISYDLTTSKVSCGDLQDQPPLETYEGSINYGNAACLSNETFAEATMGKVVLVGSSGTGRRTSSSSVCSPHELIKNSNVEIVGQKLGSGLSFSGVGNATICIKPTVPESEICSEYSEFGVSTIIDGSYSVPLSTIITVNQQGEICFDGSESGVTYVPVKLVSGWETVSGTGTQASPTQAPTKTEMPSSSSSPTDSLAPSVSSKPSKMPSLTPSAAPSKKGVGSVEVSFEVAVKLDGISNLNVDSLDSIVLVLEKVFKSMIPQNALIRLLKVGGFDVARRILRFLEEGGSDGIDVEFEVIMKEQCDTAACDNSDVVSSNLYDQVTANFKTQVDDGELSRVIQHEAELEGVSELTSVTATDFTASSATVTIEKATTGAPTLGSAAPTVAATPDTNASTMMGHGLVMSIALLVLPFIGSIFDAMN